MLKLSFCNELLAYDGMSFSEQCQVVSDLGYFGLELAPATFSDTPHLLAQSTRREIWETAQQYQLEITGLHWLLTAYPQLSITNKALRTETQQVLIGLIDLCSDLGGSVMVHGSPGQRLIPEGVSVTQTRNSVIEFFKPIAEHAQKKNITYCIEPLSKAETKFITSVEEGAEIVAAIGSDYFKTMIDTSAAGQSETLSVAALIRHWVPRGVVGHIQVNDTNRGAPGTGDDPFYEIVEAIAEVNWQAPIAIEPFEIRHNALATAAIGKATMDAHFARCLS